MTVFVWFESVIKQHELFPRILLKEVDAMDILSRIEHNLERIQGNVGLKDLPDW
jgi:hypothetical protein